MESKNWFYSLFDHLAGFLISLALLILVFFAFMAYRYYEVVTLFGNSLTMITDEIARQQAAVLIAIVTIFTTVIFMVHSQKLDAIFRPPDSENKRSSPSKIMLVIFALLINVFFWKPWEGTDLADGLFRGFICIMLSSMDYGFAHLFNELRKESMQLIDLVHLREEITTARQRYQQLVSSGKLLQQKNEEIITLIQQHTCPHCGRIFPTPKGVNAHKASCQEKNNNI